MEISEKNNSPTESEKIIDSDLIDKSAPNKIERKVWVRSILIGLGISILILLIILGILWRIGYWEPPQNSSPSQDQIQEINIEIPEITSRPPNAFTPDNPTPAKPTPPPAQLTDAEKELEAFKTYVEQMNEIVERENPRVALNNVLKDLESVRIAQEYCHSITHEIGAAALRKYNNSTGTAFEYNVDICGGGYVHGVIEYYIAQSSNPEEEIIKLCTNLNDGTCLHGLGHGIMLVMNMDIPSSVELCQKLPATGSARLWCSEGVFMENFDAENVVESKRPFLVPDNPTQICDRYTGIYRNSCYYYAGRYILKVNVDPSKSLKKCTEIKDLGDAQACIRGMAAGIVRSDLNNPVKMEEYCRVVANFAGGTWNCIQGAVNYHLLMLADESLIRTTMCNQLTTTELQSTCNRAVDVSPFKP